MEEKHRLKSKKNHILPIKSLKNHENIKNIFFFDTETQKEIVDNEEHHFLKVGYVKELDGHGYFFQSIKRFWQIITQYRYQKGTTLVFAHNMHFDFNVVSGLQTLVSLGYSIDFPVFESGTFILRATSKGTNSTNHTLLFLDTFNYFKLSVEQLGNMLDLPKGEIDFDNCTLKELKRYCKRDVEIIERVMQQYLTFIDEYKFGNLQYTSASQAFAAYRIEQYEGTKEPRFMKHQIHIHSNLEAIELEQKSYRGGRTEAFHIGEIEHITTVDINSLYPFVMRNCPFPIKLLGVRNNLCEEDLRYLLGEGLLVIADCEINTNRNIIGVRHNNKLIFPVGTFDVILTNPELFLLWKTKGKINKVRKVAIYEGATIFKTYVDELYRYRLIFQEQENYPFQSMVKLLLNSLYGKFGQKQRSLKEIGDAPIDIVSYENCIDMDTGKRFTQFIFGGKVWVQHTTDSESFNSFTGIASYVTAYARTYLFMLMQLFDEVFYCDTDSLMIPISELSSVGKMLGHRLGELKQEYEGELCIIYGAKDYQIGSVIKRKGIKRNAVEISKNVFEQYQFYKTKSLIRKGFVDRVIIEKVQKRCKREYDKGIVMPTGKVEPIRLSSS